MNFFCFEVKSVVLFSFFTQHKFPIDDMKFYIVANIEVHNVRKSLHKADPVVLSELAATNQYHEYHQCHQWKTYLYDS